MSCPPANRALPPTNPKAIRKTLLAELRRNAKANLGPLLVVCEATGGYERHVLDLCVELGIAVHKAHGSRVRCFARYLGLLAKTDPIDARVLALYGLQTPDLHLYVRPTPEVLALRDLKTRRDQVQEMLFAEKNRLEHARHASVSRSLERPCRQLCAKPWRRLRRRSPPMSKPAKTLSRKARLMRTLKGVGPVTVSAVLAFLPELGALTRSEAACLVGLAPINNDSGKFNGPRHIEAGRAAVRKTLYMTASRRHPPQSRHAALSSPTDFRRNGKPSKVVITAVMRKLIVTLNAIVRSGEPWSHAKAA